MVTGPVVTGPVVTGPAVTGEAASRVVGPTSAMVGEVVGVPGGSTRTTGAGSEPARPGAPVVWWVGGTVDSRCPDGRMHASEG